MVWINSKICAKKQRGAAGVPFLAETLTFEEVTVFLGFHQSLLKDPWEPEELISTYLEEENNS